MLSDIRVILLKDMIGINRETMTSDRATILHLGGHRRLSKKMKKE